MLTKLNVRNFKAWRELKMNFGRVTGLFGTNSSGKSSILQFLLLLKQTRNASDRSLVLDFGGGPSELVHLGSFDTAVHRLPGGEKLVEMAWTIEWDRAPRPLEFTDVPGPFQTDVTIGRPACGQLSVRRLEYTIPSVSAFHQSYVRLGVARTDGPTPKYKPLFDSDQNPAASHHDGTKADQRQEVQREPPPITAPVKTHMLPPELGPWLYYDGHLRRSSYYNSEEYEWEWFMYYGTVENKYEALMDRIYYLGPLREHPRREYRWTGAARDGVGHSGQFTIDAILAATRRGDRRRVSKGQADVPFQELIAYWLKELGLVSSFEVREIGKESNLFEVLVRRFSNAPRTALTDVGFGVSQLLPVLVLLYYVPERSIVLMEQPELHLHPSVQSGLADVILAASLHRNVQVVVESHSEHLLRRLQRRVAERSIQGEPVSASDVQLRFVDFVDGAAKLKELKLNEFGGIENWPENFFGDEMKEMAAIQRAGIKARMKARSQ